MSDQTPTPAAAPPAGADYRVRLDAFEGPLDLLLHLIRRAEVDIYDIPIVGITEQYFQTLDQLELAGAKIDIELAGEFLVMAATLTEIKARMIALADQSEPVEGADGNADSFDPRTDLVQQLLAYRKYRDSADELERRRAEWQQRFPSGRAGVHSEAAQAALEELGDVELEDVSLEDLRESFERILASVNLDRLGEHEILSDDTPIELHAADIVDRLERAGALFSSDFDVSRSGYHLRDVFEGRTRAEMVGLFLAMLDLIRNQRLVFRQAQTEAEAEADDGGIRIALRDDQADTDPDESGEQDSSFDHGQARTDSASDASNPEMDG